MNNHRYFFEKQTDFQLKAEKRREAKEQKFMEQRQEQIEKRFKEQQEIFKYEEMFNSKGW